MDYYIEWECPSCDETNYSGINRTLIEHNGLPVIPIGIGEQESYECEHCGKTMYTGEMLVFDENEI